MPAKSEKQPRWLMVCKCGATVKPIANDPGSRLGVRLTRSAFARGFGGNPAGEQGPAGSGQYSLLI
jgi:hypothetical protein